ncbi:DNA alkylation repair protein [Prauserella oleivorans]|uniref:DNA alkylation repair protein n=1 Tax=Prauserella oleivorans TaxID=1478153 RepID=A0ABW5WEV7_9PSEU
MPSPLARAVHAGLADLADPAKALDMQRYMESDMPFRGVQKPARVRLARQVFAEHPFADRDEWLAAVRELWRDATYREERYLAIDLTGHGPYAHWQSAELLPLCEELIVTGAWWDFVDEIAIRRVGPILRHDPVTVEPVIRAWAYDADRWKRRTAVICQNSSKTDTNRNLLAYCIEANIDDSDSFLRKAIGWALQQHATIEPGWVRSFVKSNPALSPLSRTEALKHLDARPS